MNYQELDILNEKLNGYRANFSQKIAQALDIEYTHESNKIEGNTLTLRETAIVIEKGLTIGGKPLNDHLEAINHAQAIDYIKDLAKATNTIADRDILQIHALILQGIDRENAGRYRSVPVMISGSKHTPPPPYVVPEKMQEMMRFYDENRETMHPIALASANARKISIYPSLCRWKRKNCTATNEPHLITKRILYCDTKRRHRKPIKVLRSVGNRKY